MAFTSLYLARLEKSLSQSDTDSNAGTGAVWLARASGKATRGQARYSAASVFGSVAVL